MVSMSHQHGPARRCQPRLAARMMAALFVVVVCSSLFRGHSGAVAFSTGASWQRRHALAALGLPLGFGTVAMDTALAQEKAPSKSKWSGFWSDPDAPNCKRQFAIAFDGLKGRLTGEYTMGNRNKDLVETARRTGENLPKGTCKKGDTRGTWTAMVDLASADADEITIDFTAAKGPKEVKAKWDNGDILFPDGKKWRKLRR